MPSPSTTATPITNTTGSETIATGFPWLRASSAYEPEVDDVAKGPIERGISTAPAWFWSDEWQGIEAEADADIAMGNVSRPMSIDQLRTRLDEFKQKEDFG